MIATAVRRPIRIAALNPVLMGVAAVLGVAAMALGAKFCLEHGLTYTCPSIAIFSFPCPGCGGTRALASLAQLEFGHALRYNPFLVITLFALLILPFRRFNWNHWSNRTWTFLGACFVLNWLYLFLFLPR